MKRVAVKLMSRGRHQKEGGVKSCCTLSASNQPELPSKQTNNDEHYYAVAA